MIVINQIITIVLYTEQYCIVFVLLTEQKTDKEIIKIVTTAEAGAIEVYNKIAKKTFGKDHDTYQLAVHIMGEEIGHEEMFENLLEKK